MLGLNPNFSVNTSLPVTGQNALPEPDANPSSNSSNTVPIPTDQPSQQVSRSTRGQEQQPDGNTKRESKPKDEQSAQPANKAESVSALTEADLKLVQKLKLRDAEVRRHEAAHKAAAGSLAKGGPTYDYQRGPDGKQYAVGGEVQISTSKGRTPEETIQRADQIRRAALAPAEPSSQDRAVAAQASGMKQEAQAELLQLKADQQAEEKQARAERREAQEATNVGRANTDKPDAAESEETAVAGKNLEVNMASQQCEVCGGSHGTSGHLEFNSKQLNQFTQVANEQLEQFDAVNIRS